MFLNSSFKIKLATFGLAFSMLLSINASIAGDKSEPEKAVPKEKIEKNSSKEIKQNKQAVSEKQRNKALESYKKGDQFFKRAQTDEAIKYFEIALKGMPSHAGLRQRLAKSYFREGREEEAVREMEFAVKFRPTEAVYQAELAWLYTKVNRNNAAMRHAKIASQLTPKAASPYVILGYCYGIKGKKDLAIKTLKKAIELDPVNTTAMIYLAEIYHDDDKLSDAIAMYEKAILQDSDNLSILLGLGNAYGEAGKAKQEEELYKKAISLYPEDPEALGRYGWYLSKSGDLSGALQYGFKANSVRISRSYDQFMGMFIAVWAGIFIVFGIIFGAVAVGAKFEPQPGEDILRSFFLIMHKEKPGRLVFTSRRIVFVPELISRSFGATRLSIEREQISDVKLDKNSSKSSLVITVGGGTQYSFKIPVMIFEPLAKLLENEGLENKPVTHSESDESSTNSKGEAAKEETEVSVDEEKVTAASYDFRPEDGEEAAESESKEGKEEDKK